MNINPEAKKILEILNSTGNEAYIVGGCVRDLLLQKTPNDWDITTECHPNKVMSIFRSFGYSYVATGLKYGTVTVISPNTQENFEVTTFRHDHCYTDNRRPDDVAFTSTLVEDLARRDFTINAMAMNFDKRIIDPFNGISDLHNKSIKCVGSPDDRFKEDSLRLLRAVRFAITLGFLIEQKTFDAIKSNISLMSNLPVERIQSEFNKIITFPHTNISTLYSLGFMSYIVPELSSCFGCNQQTDYHIYNVGEHISKSVACIEPTLHLRLAMLLHDIGKPSVKTVDLDGRGHFYTHHVVSAQMAQVILKRLKYSNSIIDQVTVLILNHNKDIMTSTRSVRRVLSSIGLDAFGDLLKVKEADLLAQSPNYYKERHQALVDIKVILNEIINEQECFTKKDLALNGKDLLLLGIPEGTRIGYIINELFKMVVDSPKLNQKEILLHIVKEHYMEEGDADDESFGEVIRRK